MPENDFGVEPEEDDADDPDEWRDYSDDPSREDDDG